MSDVERTRMRDRIARNIRESGLHIYIVQSSAVPRYAYTIGLSQSHLPELVLAGALYYSANDALRIVGTIAQGLRNGLPLESTYIVDGLGSFLLRPAAQAWTKWMMLGSIDYYGGDFCNAVQILPDKDHWTLDVPDLRSHEGSVVDPVWKWASKDWPYVASPRSFVTTNLQMIQGKKATEAVRWDVDEWEVFAGHGPEVDADDVRVIPLATALGIDKSLERVVRLEVGQALWRDDEDSGEWKVWGR